MKKFYLILAAYTENDKTTTGIVRAFEKRKKACEFVSKYTGVSKKKLLRELKKNGEVEATEKSITYWISTNVLE